METSIEKRFEIKGTKEKASIRVIINYSNDKDFEMVNSVLLQLKDAIKEITE